MESDSSVLVDTFWQLGWLKRTYVRLCRSSPGKVTPFLVLVSVLLVLVGFFAYLLVQDVADSARIFDGITVDGKPVGGLTRNEAAELVTTDIQEPLNQPMTLYHQDQEFPVVPAHLGFTVDIDGMIDKAYWTGQERFILERMFRRFFNKSIYADIPIIYQYDGERLSEFVSSVAEVIDYPATNASIDISSGTPEITPSRNGQSLDRETAVSMLGEALARNERRIQLPVRVVEPEFATEDIGPIVVIKQSEYKLYLYDGETLEDTYAVAVGSPKYPTPNGSFSIIKKEKDPTWYPPKSEWAKDEEPIPPGPGNPLGPYWMDLGNGLGIHSTYDEASLGYSVSHGCVRMSEWGAMMLFDEVEVGTPVYILP